MKNRWRWLGMSVLVLMGSVGAVRSGAPAGGHGVTVTAEASGGFGGFGGGSSGGGGASGSW